MDVDPVGLATSAFELKPKQKSLIIRILWVLAVTLALLRLFSVLGFLTSPSMFAYADDMAKVINGQNRQLALSLAGEIRAQVTLRCRTTDGAMRSVLDSNIDNLQQQYADLNAGRRYHEPGCDGR